MDNGSQVNFLLPIGGGCGIGDLSYAVSNSTSAITWNYINLPMCGKTFKFTLSKNRLIITAFELPAANDLGSKASIKTSSEPHWSAILFLFL